MRAPRRLNAFQTQAESLMTLTLAAYEPGGETIVNGLKVEGYTPKGSTFGKVQGGSSTSKDTVDRYVTVGGVERPVLNGGLHIPISATIPRAGASGVGWEYQVTAVGPHDDPALLGRRYLIVSVPMKSHATARRLDVVEVS